VTSTHSGREQEVEITHGAVTTPQHRHWSTVLQEKERHRKQMVYVDQLMVELSVVLWHVMQHDYVLQEMQLLPQSQEQVHGYGNVWEHMEVPTLLCVTQILQVAHQIMGNVELQTVDHM